MNCAKIRDFIIKGSIFVSTVPVCRFYRSSFLYKFISETMIIARPYHVLVVRMVILDVAHIPTALSRKKKPCRKGSI